MTMTGTMTKISLVTKMIPIVRTGIEIAKIGTSF